MININHRLRKQILIAVIFLGIISVLFYLLFFYQSLEASCFNNRKDKNEEGIDCGGVCEKSCIVINPPQIISKKLFKLDNPSKNSSYYLYDFFVIIKNQNSDLGSGDINYELNFFDKDNNIIFSKLGSLYLLPGQLRYEVIPSIKTKNEIYEIDFKIKSVSWQKLKEFIPQALFIVKTQELLDENSAPKIKGILFNNSNFNFDKVDVYAVLYDQNNNPIAVNKTDIRTFLAKKESFFEMKWLKKFPEKIERIDIQAYTNLFKNENFIKEYGTQEKFQEFY